LLIYLIGLLMGICSGLAIGGGTLLVPALVILAGVSQHTAQGVCLAAFVPTAVIAVITHYRQHNVNFRLTLYLTAGSLIGAVIGSSLANIISAGILQKIFGIFLLCMGLYELLGKARKIRE